MRRWFVVYTRAGQERLAEGNLLAQGFDAYMPRLAVRRKLSGKVCSATVPMFPRYLFVNIDMETMPWRSINGTFGVSHLVSFGERPAPVADAVVEEVRSREDEDGIIRLAKASPFKAGEKVEIADGPLSDVKGLFTARSESERVIVLMSLLGRDVPVRVSPDKLRRAG